MAVYRFSRQSPNTIRAVPATPDATPARMGVTFEVVFVGADGVVQKAPVDGDGEGAGLGAGVVAGVVSAVFEGGVGAGVVAGVVGGVFKAGVGTGVVAGVVGAVFGAGVGAGVVAGVVGAVFEARVGTGVVPGVANTPVSSIATIKSRLPAFVVFHDPYVPPATASLPSAPADNAYT